MNLAEPLSIFALKNPRKKAVVVPQTSFFGKKTKCYISFEELNQRSDFFAAKFRSEGLNPGDRVLVFIKPSTSFSVITFALFKAGIVPVFLDPGMGRKNLLNAISQIKAKGLIGEPIVLTLKKMFSKSFQSIEITYNVAILKKIPTQKCDFTLYEAHRNEEAAVLFTSGGTGIPKGVMYTHNIFINQRRMLKELFKLDENERDLPGFPLFGLFTLTMGMTSILPELNPSKPAKVNPKKVVHNIAKDAPTFVAGSPAIWWRILEYCEKEKLTLDSVKYLVMFGAPVPIEMHERLKKILPHGDTFTPYGATECLPVTCISGTEVLSSYKELMNKGHGTCVGKAVQGVQIEIAPITDEAIKSVQDITFLGPHQLGEICVCSETVTPKYIDMPAKTELAKMSDSNKSLWHRMGDLGYIDNDGMVWFCGRKTHRIEGDTITPPVPLENIINNMEGVKRSALIAPHNKATLLIQKKNNSVQLSEENIKKQIKNSPYGLSLDHIEYVKAFPVDGRHNIKIDRLLLKKQYERRS